MSLQTSFINSIKDGAIVSMKKYGVLASITISQAILESAWGRSKLTYKYKNLFGIKADSNWKGPRINMRTGEYRNGSHVMENWGFRVYSSYGESIKDHARFLVNNPRYGKAGLFSANNYTGQANALVKAGYATNPGYGKQLVRLIEQYNLSQYDSEVILNKRNTKLWQVSISGDIVKELQRELNRQFQAGLRVDGWFGDDTLNKCCVVRYGARGGITRVIQKILINKNYKIVCDGIFGYATEKAVRHFQGNKGLRINGVVGRGGLDAIC